MRNPFDADSDDGTVFRDVTMLALLGFITVVVLLLPHLHPPVETTKIADPPGNVVVEARWPDGLNADVDLWVQAPGDVPVGYSNKGGEIFNLLRDDLGQVHDSGSLNFEMAFSRGRPEGEYIVNLHLYRARQVPLPIPVEVRIALRPDQKRSAVTLTTERIELHHQGEETTVVRFRLDEGGRLIPGSMHDLPKALRSAKG